MKRPKIAVLLFVAFLLVYLLFLKNHYSTSKAPPFRPPPHAEPGLGRTDDGRLGSADGLNFQYGIMFDAGSTGTRVHIFKLQMKSREPPTVDHETFEAIKPGLSAYADDPEKCAAGIQKLLLVARSSVPPSMWARTPLVLKATAGLRLLPGEKAKQLLDKVRQIFQESPFLSRDDSVSIMEGTDEGISAWITVNVLIGGLGRADSTTVGMLDLGGGSTQITFSPRDEKTIQTSPVDFIRSFQMFNRTHTVYTHSYLGLGLMSARLTVLGGSVDPSGGSTELVSPCLPPQYSGSWKHAEVVFTVKGQKAGEPVFEACLSRVQKVLYGKVNRVSEVEKMDFYAFSYYYERAADLGIIDEKEGGAIKVSDYTDAARRVCSGPPAGPQQDPFLCLDLVYISVLLQEFGFPPHQQLRLAKTINQVETSWALGATFNYMESLRGS
ncbi:ectonucleoside triphosphate diphosphohydrolase 6 [Oryzias melastigma]|uniref:ectonucleoside triphosphate diphosphohydrolase 6 n=1 Tax=Oryzias melastigma TaxID=30732 RepID=UPI000CF7B3D3|nr:ectonucleoside triphosphate diphosphohydrolase 6 [Oryzias melastigma]